MTFCEQLWSTLIGSVLGFVFALVLFYLQERRNDNKKKKNIAKCLKREFEYNLNLVNEWITIIDRILQKISVQDHQILHFLRYSSYQRFYFYQSFHFGVSYDYFDNDDVKIISDIENHLNINIEQEINSFIKKWNRQEIDPKVINSIFDCQKQQLQKEKRNLENLLNKLIKKFVA